jgi:phosphoserine aminotransferase
MSSDILSHEVDFNQFAMFYAGAQKNLGPSGVTLIVLRNDMLKRINDGLPTIFDYRTHVEKKSLFNTPPSFMIYVVKLIL